jgi:hypothetical protein
VRARLSRPGPQRLGRDRGAGQRDLRGGRATLLPDRREGPQRTALGAGPAHRAGNDPAAHAGVPAGGGELRRPRIGSRPGDEKAAGRTIRIRSPAGQGWNARGNPCGVRVIAPPRPPAPGYRPNDETHVPPRRLPGR